MRTFEPSTLPTTRKPSSEYPTSRPTVTKKVLISSSLVLAGIRPSDVSDDDTELLKEVLVDSIESLIETSQINVSALESYSATRRRSLLSGGDRMRVDIDVLVVEDNFFDELKKAVVDGSLDEAMSQSESKALSSSSVDKEESIRLITEQLSYESEAPTPAEDGKGGGGKDGFSSSTNFAIAVGASVAGLILLALPAGAFLCKRQRDIKPLVQSSRTLIGDREADDSIHIQLDVADEQEQESAKAKRGSSPRKFTSMRSRSYQVRATARKFLFEDGRILWRTSADPGVPDSLVRQLEEDGSVDLVKSRSGIKDFCVVNAKLREDLERAPALNLNDRMQALRCHLGTLRVKWNVGRVQFTVSRSNLAGNAFETIGNLAVDRWRQPFFITFKDEAGLDAGGVSREFFRLLMDELFDVKYGLFKYGTGYTYQLADDAESLVAFDGDAEARDARYTFVGRLLGKALLEGHMISAHPTIPLLKHIACEPVGLADLQLLDYLYWRNLNELATMDSDLLASLELTFSVVTETFGQHVEQELIPGGKDVAVTSSNVKQLLELRLKQRVCDVHKNGLAAFLRGIYDVSIFCLLSEAGRYIERRTQVVPAEMLMLLSARELELVLCGVPEIRVDEWRASCQYGGEFKSEKEAHRVVAYFWEILETWENEKKAQLLQWCTGTAALPVQGFEYLQGRDGVIRKFALTSVSLDQAIYPRAHTCFNRIDLPLYKTKRDLEEALDFVLLNSASQTFSMD